MPANLPPQYQEAERRFRCAKTPEDKIEALEEMLSVMPKHKGTDKLKADLRRRLSRLKEETQQRRGGVRLKNAYAIEKEGAAQVVLVGLPNTGKSSLVAALTNAEPEVAPFPYSTHKPTPGMAVFENIAFQLIDTPPVTRDYVDPDLADLIRRTDLLSLLVDIRADPLQQLADTMEILRSFRVFPAGAPLPADLTKAPFVKRALVAVTKVDSASMEGDFQAFVDLSGTSLPCVGVSPRSGRNLGAFLAQVFACSGVLRVYTKSPGKEADRSAPFVLAAGSTVEELAGLIHKDFVSRLRYARVWGSSVHDGQKVPRSHPLRDGDVVELHC